MGIFQLESSGMQELVRKMAPTCWDDITAICALYRPGPLGADMDKVYVERKHGRLKVEYKDPGARAHPAGHLRGDPLPGAGHADRLGHGRLHHGPGRHAAQGHGQEEDGHHGGDEGPVPRRRAGGGLRRARRPRDLRGDGVLRPVRLQQEPLRRLRPALHPDRLAEGPPSGRVHGRHHDHRDEQGRAHHPAHRRGQGPGPRHPPAGHQPALQRVRRRRRRDRLRHGGGQGRGRRRPSRSSATRGRSWAATSPTCSTCASTWTCRR